MRRNVATNDVMRRMRGPLAMLVCRGGISIKRVHLLPHTHCHNWAHDVVNLKLSGTVVTAVLTKHTCLSWIYVMPFVHNYSSHEYLSRSSSRGHNCNTTDLIHIECFSEEKRHVRLWD